MQPFRPNEPAYAGVGITFCRVPLALDAAAVEGADIAIIGAPFDDGVSNRPGARFGPRAIRAADDLGWPPKRPHMDLGIDPFTALKVVDCGDIAAAPADLAVSQERLRAAIAGVLHAGAMPLVLGGDHSLAYPTMQALAEAYEPDGYAVIHLDTHTDTGADVLGVANSHGTPFYRAVKDGMLKGNHIFQIGLRGAWPGPTEFDWMRQHGFRWRTMDECIDRGLDEVIYEAIDWANSTAPSVYLTIDIDVLDPAFAPGTGTPEPGGFSTRELLHAIRKIARGVDLCAMDIVEVSPPYDVSDITALAANRIVLETMSAIALRRGSQRPRPERCER
ncbi:MAG: agmatinase [Thermomicrobiales bacterium]